MKIRNTVLLILVSLLMTFFPAGCGNTVTYESETAIDQSSDGKVIEQTAEETAGTEEDAEEAEGTGAADESSALEESESAEEDTAEEVESEPAEELPVLETGVTVTIPDTAEFYLDYTDITEDVLPPTPASFYTHYEAEDGKVYVDVCVAYKNVEEKSIMADDAVSAALTYAGKYEYSGFSIIEKDSRSSFTYTNITSVKPLIVSYIHYLFEVPEELAEGTESIEVTLKIDGCTYIYTVR